MGGRHTRCLRSAFALPSLCLHSAFAPKVEAKGIQNGTK